MPGRTLSALEEVYKDVSISNSWFGGTAGKPGKKLDITQFRNRQRGTT
jgi:hypothetical protein